MQPDLDSLKLTNREVEQHCQLEVNDLLIGGIWGGVYRTSIFRDLHRFWQLCFTELAVFGIVFIFSLPLGFFVIRHAVNLNHPSTAFQFLAITIGSTVTIILSWHGYMLFAARKFKTLARLLDEIDRYNQMIAAVAVLDQLAKVQNSQIGFNDRDQVLEALQITRDSLVAGLMTDKILRENWRLMTARQDLLMNIEHSLLNLQTIAANDQASEYGKILNEALQIGISVQQELLTTK
jgi:hypothetical protein